MKRQVLSLVAAPSAALRFSLALLVLAALVAPVPAAAAPDLQQEPISMDLVDAGARDVLASFGTMADAEVKIDGELDGKVTISLANVRWMTALDAVCESVGCAWTIVGGHPRRLEIVADAAREGADADGPDAEGPDVDGLGARISLSLSKAKGSNVLESFGRIAGYPVEIPQGLDGTVSFELQGVTARTALTAVCESLGCRWSIEAGTLSVALAERGGASESEEESMTLDQRLALPLSLSLADAPLEAVLKSYASILGVPLNLSDGVDGLVTIELVDTPARDALDQVCAATGCRWSLTGNPGEEVLEVVASAS